MTRSSEPHKRRAAARIAAAGRSVRGVCALIVGAGVLGYGINRAQDADFIPLPHDVLPKATADNPIMSLAESAIERVGKVDFSPKVPESFIIRNNNGNVYYDSENRQVIYTGGSREGERYPLFLRTKEGYEIYAEKITANFETKQAELEGPLLIYQGETMTRAASGTYDWGNGEAEVNDVRSKITGLILRGSRLEYKKDEKGENYVIIHDTYVCSEDVEKPSMWVGAGKMTIYPGDSGSLSHLSVATGDYDTTVPVLGWFTISHSLNPQEGYLPIPGSKGIWGTYLRNRYGVLLGNRRVEHGMPVADYIATGLLDYRSRRGYGGGLELVDEKMHKKYRDTNGFAFYYAADRQPDINPTRRTRKEIKGDRYRVALQAVWEVPYLSSDEAQWRLYTTSTVVSDQYMLRDFFEDISRVDDKPDNSVWLTRKTKRDELQFLTRFAPNDYYSTDRRSELTYYRVRSPLGDTRIFYETRNSAGIINQYITPDQRNLYRDRINNLRYAEMRDYYTRLLNTTEYFRVNTTHELSTSFNVFRFLNVTPKAGTGYTGYYGVEGVGADNRWLGYTAVDFDIKFNRHFRSLRVPSMGIYGVYHVFHPYATLSHGSTSSSNDKVPQVDMWSNRLGSSTINPMPLDLIGFTGIDAWGTWTIWRLGTRNTFSTIYDGESRSLLDWDLFLDYNITNPNTESTFSNLFSIITLSPIRQLHLTLETQTPTIRDGDGFYQYNTSATIIPVRWFEATVGHRFIKDHPTRGDANQVYTRANLRFNERYTASTHLSWDIESHRMPIQQYSLFRKFGPWYVGTTVFLRNNGGKKEHGAGMSFTFGETGSAIPLNLF